MPTSIEPAPAKSARHISSRDSQVTGLSLLIPTYNRCAYLRRTLASLAALDVPQQVEIEVIVIDNNCTDDTATVVRDMQTEFPFELRHVIETEQGLCHGRNRGLQEGRHAHLAYLDDDIEVDPRWVRGYVAAVEQQGADYVVGPVFPLFEQEQPDYLGPQALRSISSGYSRRGEENLTLDAKSAHELPGCNFGVKRDAGREVGGFNIHLDRSGKGLLAGGDFDFGHRLATAGYRGVYHPHCGIQHIILPDKLTKTYLRQRAYGIGATVKKTRPAPIPWYRYPQGLAGIGRLWLATTALRITASPKETFDKELETRTAMGYWFG